MRVVILGAGFGGLELASTLSQELGAGADVVLIDRSDGFVFGFSKLDVMFGRSTAEHVHHRYADLAQPGVRFVAAEVTEIDPTTKRVQTTAGVFDADILVVALGAELDPAATPGLVEAGHDFYSEAGAFAAREVLADFAGGTVVIGVCSTPFKCPPAPSETALLVHDLLVEKGVREQSEIILTTPLPSPVPPSPDASAALLAAFAERDIQFHPQTLIRELDPASKVALTSEGEVLPFDLFLGVPKHCVPAAVESSGLAVDGWIPVDRVTLETSFADVYAVGDVTSVGTPKAGVFSEGQASVVAAAIVQRLRGGAAEAGYDGRGQCYFEFGHGAVARVDVTFAPNAAPTGWMEGPSADLAGLKVEFGESRIKRWFGRDWTMFPD